MSVDGGRKGEENVIKASELDTEECRTEDENMRLEMRWKMDLKE